MLLNGKKFSLVQCSLKNIDRESIVYSEEYNKLMVLNETALFIWNKLTDALQNEYNVSIKSIEDSLMREYQIPEEGNYEIREDIMNILLEFEREGFLIYY